MLQNSSLKAVHMESETNMACKYKIDGFLDRNSVPSTSI